jgi:hypothetical protein
MEKQAYPQDYQQAVVKMRVELWRGGGRLFIEVRQKEGPGEQLQTRVNIWVIMWDGTYRVRNWSRGI